jgi:hypothetical protein
MTSDPTYGRSGPDRHGGHCGQVGGHCIPPRSTLASDCINRTILLKFYPSLVETNFLCSLRRAVQATEDCTPVSIHLTDMLIYTVSIDFVNRSPLPSKHAIRLMSCVEPFYSNITNELSI